VLRATGRRPWSIALVGLPRAAADCGRTEPPPGALALFALLALPCKHSRGIFARTRPQIGHGDPRSPRPPPPPHSFSTTASGSCLLLQPVLNSPRTIYFKRTIRRVLPPFDDNAGFDAMIMCSRASVRRCVCYSAHSTKSSHPAA